MSLYDGYKHLLGVDYDDGDHDCYGLVRRYYIDTYGLELPNYARSADFFAEGVDILTDGLVADDFKVVDVPTNQLRPGDGLLMCIPNRDWPKGKINHLGVFVGNHTFIHHLWKKKSCEDYMSPQWADRIMAVVRHPSIAEKNAERIRTEATDFISLIPEHVRRKYGITSTPVLGTDAGEVRPDPDGRVDSRAEEPAPGPGQLPDGGPGGGRSVRKSRG